MLSKLFCDAIPWIIPIVLLISFLMNNKPKIMLKNNKSNSTDNKENKKKEQKSDSNKSESSNINKNDNSNMITQNKTQSEANQNEVPTVMGE